MKVANTIELKFPIEIEGKAPITSIKMRRLALGSRSMIFPVLAAFQDESGTDESRIEALVQLLPACTGLSPEEVDLIDFEDIGAITDGVTNFFTGLEPTPTS